MKWGVYVYYYWLVLCFKFQEIIYHSKLSLRKVYKLIYKQSEIFVSCFICSEKFIPPSMTSPLDVHVTENEDAVFEVRVSGHPSPDVTWYQGGTALTPSVRVKIEIDGNVRRLILGKCQLEDGGKVKVRASNKSGRKTEETTLVVKGLFIHSSWELLNVYS